MKVLITGANGFLGKVIYKKLITNYYISTLARKNSDYCVDLGSEERINFKEKFELVIHFAGKAHNTPKTKLEKKAFFNINVKGTKQLLDSLTYSGIPKQFVYISSVSVYGMTEGILINENALLKASDPYGKSKIKAEEIIQKWCTKNNVICTILRLPLVVGPNPPGNLGAMINAIRKGYYFNIAGGNAKKSMVLATDIAKFILKAAEIGGVYNLSDGYHPSFKELSKNIASQIGKNNVANLPLFIANLLAKFGDVLGNKIPFNTSQLLKITSTLTFDDTKARIAFGWEPSSVLDEFKLTEE